MCDYSLELIRSRPAKAGDKLVSTSFPNTPTRSFAAADDHSVAVCLLPGTELSFEEEIRCDGMIFSWSPGHKVAKFQQLNKAKRHVYHDALEFPDGKIVLLTQLREGQYATVLNCRRFRQGVQCMTGNGGVRSSNSRALRDDGSPDPGVNARVLNHFGSGIAKGSPGNPLLSTFGDKRHTRWP